MIRLFLAAVLPSLIVLIALPALARTGDGDRPAAREPITADSTPALALMATQERRQDRRTAKADAEVSIAEGSFDPKTVTIRVGQTVAWTNSDDRDHQVAGDKGEFKSGTIKPGESFQFKFEKAGEFKFHCPLHPRARGVVKVAA